MSGVDIELVTFERRGGERLAVMWREYEGHHFVDLRIQFKTEDGEWKPTKKGVTIKVHELWNAGDAIAKACELAKAVAK